MPTPTKRLVNWASVSVAAQAITGVTSVMFDDGGSLRKFSGDGDRSSTTTRAASPAPPQPSEPARPSATPRAQASAKGDSPRSRRLTLKDSPSPYFGFPPKGSHVIWCHNQGEYNFCHADPDGGRQVKLVTELFTKDH